MNRVFVYGSLMAGMSNAGLLATAKFVGAHITLDPAFSMYSVGPYPAVARTTPGWFIRGEVYLVDDLTLRRLDRLEGHPSSYRRELVDVTGSSEPAWMYMMPAERLVDLPVVPRGDWRGYFDPPFISFLEPNEDLNNEGDET